MIRTAHQPAHPLQFFAWVLGFSAPFYVWGVLWPVHGLPLGLPATAVMIVVPAAVATILTRRERGASAAWELWRRVGDVKRIRGLRWIVISLLCMPVACAVAYALMRVLGLPLPTTVSIPVFRAPVIFAAYFVGAIFEEIGWTGYATEPLQMREGVLYSGLTIGAVWAIWHIVPWWLGQGHLLSWVLGQALATVAMRVIMGWIYAHGGRSLFLAIVFHAMINTSFSLFPNEGSHYNPLVIAATLAIMAGSLALKFFFNRTLPRREAAGQG